MSANFSFARLVVLALGFLLCAGAQGSNEEEEAAETAVLSLTKPLEKEGFDFRADIWERPLAADIGKAVRVQLFKGNDYRVCVAVSRRVGVNIEAHVVDINGQSVEEKSDARGWGTVLTVKPKHTGVHVVTIRESGGKPKTVVCTMIMGYK
jgi:hypothetical protein